jgi:hypothetical protein
VIFCIVWWIVAINIDDARAPRTAETLGFINVRVEDSTIWFTGFRGCGVGDMKMWYVSGVDPNGVRRSFIVCAGAFKGNTLRVK